MSDEETTEIAYHGFRSKFRAQEFCRTMNEIGLKTILNKVKTDVNKLWVVEVFWTKPKKKDATKT